MESLRELNQICQKPRYKEEGNWMVRTFLRDAALPVTWLLLHTRVSANQVTLAALFIGLFGELLWIFDSKSAFFAGCLLLQLWYLLDHVDGQIARYRKTASLSGRYFDFLMHHIIHAGLYFFLGLYGYRQSEDVIWLYLSFLTSFSILFFNLSYDIASKAILEKIYQEGMVTKKVGVEMSGKSEKGDRLGNQPVPFFGFELKRVYSLLHKSCEIHVVMNILTLLSVINLTWKGFEGRWIFIYYAVCVPGMTLVKFCHVIINKKVDGEYEEKLRG